VVEFDRENGEGFVYFIDSENDIDRIMAKVTSAQDGNRWRAERIRVANSNSWAAKIESMCTLIEEKSRELQLSINQDWLGRFKRFYKVAHKKAIKVIGIALVFYLVLFYTPLIWFLASPLKITNKPQKADAIVVFGGGVGEGGRPGPGTTERAGYSVELYKKGYARQIIFSSGYTYKYNDAETMMHLARSMGVPKDRILLEQKAGSTFENVKYSVGILERKKWKKIILITSPYNTRRAELVFNKIAGGKIDVLYCPVKKSQFYYRYGILRLDQLDAIIHEYLGIIYYFFKGYA